MQNNGAKPKKKKSRFHVNTNIDFQLKTPLQRTIVYFIFIAAILMGAGYQVIRMNVNKEKKFDTVTAIAETIEDVIETEAFVLREETCLHGYGSGTVVPLVADGTKISGGDAVAGSFSGFSQAELFLQIREVEKDIAYYESLQKGGGSSLADIRSYDSKISENFYAMLDSIDSNQFDSLQEYAENFRYAVTKKSIASGTPVEFAAELANLNIRLENLRAQLGNYDVIYADRAGYYVQNADGYEIESGIYSGIYQGDDLIGDIKNVSADFVDGLFALRPSGNNVSPFGKLITGFSWYVLFNTDASSVEDTEVGAKLQLSFPESGMRPVTVTVAALNKSSDNRVAVVLTGTVMDARYANLRKCKIRLQLNEKEGFRIDLSAYRNVDGESGVYVLLGNEVKFRKIKINYAGDGFYLAEKMEHDAENANEYLQSFDEIIMKGVDLKDGKIIN